MIFSLMEKTEYMGIEYEFFYPMWSGNLLEGNSGGLSEMKDMFSLEQNSGCLNVWMYQNSFNLWVFQYIYILPQREKYKEI